MIRPRDQTVAPRPCAKVRMLGGRDRRSCNSCFPTRGQSPGRASATDTQSLRPALGGLAQSSTLVELVRCRAGSPRQVLRYHIGTLFFGACVRWVPAAPRPRDCGGGRWKGRVATTLRARDPVRHHPWPSLP